MAKREEERITGMRVTALSPVALVLIFLFIAHAIGPHSYAKDVQDLQKGKDELQGLRKEIKEKKKGLEKAGKKEKNLLLEIERINKRLSVLEKDELRLDREIILLEKGLREKSYRISCLNLEAEKKKELLKRRLVYLYKSGNIGHLHFLFSSEGITDFSRKMRYMESIAAYDRELIESYGRDAEELFLQMEQTLDEKEELKLKEVELQKKRDEIKKEKKERDRLLASARMEKKQYRRSLKELEANAKNLQRLLKKLEKEAALRAAERKKEETGRITEFEKMKGKLNLPVDGEVTGFFGKEQDKETRSVIYRKGIDIKTREGAPVRVVYDGRVIFADQFQGYGFMMIIDHGEGYYTLYANLADPIKKVNDEINKGDIIGKVKAGDDAETTLYFEVRKKGKPENPLEWLKS